MLKLIILAVLVALSFNSEWQQCTDDLSMFECRQVQVPRLYEDSTDPKAEGTLNTMHRRLKVGTPDKYILLISGGPGGNADVISYAVVPQLQKAFPEGNYIVHIPSLRGTANTDRIQAYSGFPANLQQVVENSDYLPEFFTPTNSAKDIIATVKEAQQEWPGLTFHAMGFSFGTFQLQRVLEIEPNLFKTVILDGSCDSINSNNQFEFQQAGLGSLSERIELNCMGSEYCRARSLSREDLTKFINETALGATNDCLDWFVQQISPGAPPSYSYEILSSAVNSLAMASNIEIPYEFLSNDPTILENQKQFVKFAINTFNGNFGKEGYIYMDLRVYYWTLLNQLAVCPSLDNFKQGAGFLTQIIQMAGQLIPYMLSSESPLGNAYVTQILNLASENITNLAVNQEYINSQQAQGPIRTPSSMFASQIELVNQVIPIAPEISEYVEKTPVEVTAHVVFLTGLLDPNVPLTQTLSAINNLHVKENEGKIEHFIHKNAGHTVIGLGFSKCSPKLMRGIVADDETAMSQYLICLEEENESSLNWEASDVKELLGKDIWQGITVKGEETSSLSKFHLIFFLIAIFFAIAYQHFVGN